MYALVIDTTIDAIGLLPAAARRLDTGEWVMPPGGLTSAALDLQHACGWYEIVDTPRPDDSDTQTYDRDIVLVDGTPTVTWTARDWTQDELDAHTQTANRSTLQDQAADAIATNQAALALGDPTPTNDAFLALADPTSQLNTYLAIGSPTNAQVVAEVKLLTQIAVPLVAQLRATTGQNSALIGQVRALTAQNTKLIQLVLDLLGVTGILDTID